MNRYPLYYLTWNATGKCNLYCKHCYASAGLQYSTEELSTAQIKAVIADAVENLGLQFMLFTGGEPLLRQDLPEVMQFAKESGVEVFLASNGTLMTPQFLERIKGIVSKINISLDASTEEKHDNIRGVRGAFSRALKGIEATLSHGIPVSVSMTVHDENLEDIENVANICKRYGVPMTIKRFIPTGRGKSNLTISQETYARLCEAILRLKRDGHKITFKDPIYSNQFEAGSQYGCFAGIHIASIKCNGDVLACTKLNHVFGNVKTTKLSEIWNTDTELKALRDRLLKGNCGACRKKYACGGCRAAALEYADDMLDQDPFSALCTSAA